MAKQTADRTSSGGMAGLLMILAIVAIAGLMVWLGFASRPDESAVVAVDATGDTGADAGPTAQSVAASVFGADVRAYWGQEINLTGVNVAQIVSREIIWVDLPTAQGDAPFPVKLTLDLAAAGGTPATQTTVDIEGRVLEKTDSALSAWEASGAIPNAGVRTTLEFGSTYIEARRIRPSAGS